MAVPKPTPVTSPELDIVATVTFELDHRPPEVGITVVVSPIHISEGPVKNAGILSRTVIFSVAKDVQPVDVLVKTKLTVPRLIPVTSPALDTEPTDVFVDDQMPPELGDNVVVPKIQISSLPVIDTMGSSSSVVIWVAVAEHPFALVTSTEICAGALTNVNGVVAPLFQIKLTPPVAVTCVNVPLHTEVSPNIFAIGFANTLISSVVFRQEVPKEV